MDDLRFASIRAVRKLREKKDRFFIIVKYLINRGLDIVEDKYWDTKVLLTKQALAYRDISLGILRRLGDFLGKHQESLIQGAAGAGAAAAVLATAFKTILNDKWRLMQQFVPPTYDMELEAGTMVYAPVSTPPASSFFGSMAAQPQRVVSEPKWMLCEVQGRAVAGEYVQVMAYSTRNTIQVPFEDLKLARPEDQFLLTVMQGDPAAIAQSLESTGADVNTRDITGNTALNLICEVGNKEAAVFLLENGANPNIPNLKGSTPLITASTRGQVDLVNVLLDYGARVNKALPDGKTPLYQAVAAGHTAVAERLLERGARPNQLTDRNFSPLFMACQAGDATMVKLLLAHGAAWTMNVAADLGQGKATPLFMAAQKGQLGIVQALAEAGVDLDKGTVGKNRASPLMVAAQNGNAPIASYLLQCGADPDKKIRDGSAAINLAIQFGHMAVVQALADGGANLDNQDKRGFTPLHMAVQSKQPRMIEILLDGGADANYFSLHNRLSPLLLALHQAKENGGPLDVAKMLIPASARELHVCDRDGHNAFYVGVLACKGVRDRELILQMLRTGANPFEVTRPTGGPRRPQPTADIWEACAKADRHDLAFIIENYDHRNPEKIDELVKQRDAWFKEYRDAKDNWRGPHIPGYDPLCQLPSSLQLQKRAPMEEIQRISEEMKRNATLTRIQKATEAEAALKMERKTRRRHRKMSREKSNSSLPSTGKLRGQENIENIQEKSESIKNNSKSDIVEEIELIANERMLQTFEAYKEAYKHWDPKILPNDAHLQTPTADETIAYFESIGALGILEREFLLKPRVPPPRRPGEGPGRQQRWVKRRMEKVYGKGFDNEMEFDEERIQEIMRQHDIYMAKRRGETLDEYLRGDQEDPEPEQEI